MPVDPRWREAWFDSPEEIFQKAQLGQVVTTRELAEGIGVDASVLRSLRIGAGWGEQEEIGKRLALVLGLDPGALSRVARPRRCDGAEQLPEGVEHFVTPFRDFHVNHFLVQLPSGRSVLFDTGADPEVIRGLLRRGGLRLAALFLTHGHTDHIAEVPLLRELVPGLRIVAHPASPVRGIEPTMPGDEVDLDGFRVRVGAGTAHREDSLVYHLALGSRRYVVAGDALFAGSIGAIRTGRAEDYRDALRVVREEILAEPEETVVLPGHGPVTTVGRERVENPFFAGNGEG